MTLVPLPDTLTEPLVRNALNEDLDNIGDITTDAVVPPERIWRSVFVARKSGVVAGLDLVRMAFRLVDPSIAFNIVIPDGIDVDPGDTIAIVHGPAASIITAERVGTAAKIFTNLGVEVYSADTVSKALSAINAPAYQSIIDHFGEQIVQKNGEIDRRALRTIIFSDLNERKWLENLLHPLIRKELEALVESCTTPYCVVEIPLLLTKEHYSYLNRILVIVAPEEIQISRVIERD